MSKYACFDIANFFLDRANKTGSHVSNLKLQKLVFYAQAWHLAMYDQSLFDDDFEAWIHGPVIPVLWKKYKSYKYKPIDEEVAAPELGDKTNGFLEEVVEAYFGEDAYTMELMTHREMPWLSARKGHAPYERCSVLISKDSMKEFFKDRLDNG